ncbi:hypothetical protein FQR65_LT16350 [Abscondita terminalis]|nr:hypothetical protein FQR65_LT16350 [Abscondita terminalis]
MLVINEAEVEFLGDSNFRRLLTNILGFAPNKLIIQGKQKISQQLAIGGQTIGQLHKRVVRIKEKEEIEYNLAPNIFIGGNNILQNHSFNTMRHQMIMLLSTIKSLKTVESVKMLTLPCFPKMNKKQKKTLTKFNTFIRNLRHRQIKIIDIENVFTNKYFERMSQTNQLVYNMDADGYNFPVSSFTGGNISLEDPPTIFVTNEAVGVDDTSSLKNLLKKFNLLQLLPVLQACGVSYRSLVYLSKEDINPSVVTWTFWTVKDTIADIGLRAEFRTKLFEWRKTEHDFDTDSITNSSKSLQEVLSESNKGKSILEYYKKNLCLDKLRRDSLVTVILEDIHYNGTNLSPKDYPNILAEIESNFPSEKKFLDYYFFCRQKRKNPGGRLYNKYVNSKKTIEIKCFDTHFQSCEVGKPLDTLELLPIECFTSSPLHVYPCNNGKVYFRNKFL